MAWPFSKKILCDQCDKKFKAASSVPKRGFKFCSESCRDVWVEEHPSPRATEGTPAEHQQNAVRALQYAQHELTNVINSNGGHVVSAASLAGGLVAASAALNALEAAQDGVSRFSEHLSEAMPFLHALELGPDVEALEDFDTMEIFEFTKAGSGPLQQRKIRKLVEPVHEVGERLLARLREMSA